MANGITDPANNTLPLVDFLKESLWRQFGASIDMLKNAIVLWPEDHATTDKKFFYNAYHCLVFLDYYLTIPPKNFSPSVPFTLTEPADIPEQCVDDVVPNRQYTKPELLHYVQHCRQKCRTVIAGLTEEKLKQSWIAGPGPMDLSLSGRNALTYSVLEILLYNMKHVQHHVAQLNLMLRQTINDAPGYVSNVEDGLA